MSDPRPRLLAISPVAPWPLDNGFSLRVAHVLRELAAGWKVTLVGPMPTTGPLPDDLRVDRFVPLRPRSPSAFLPWQTDAGELRTAVSAEVATEVPAAALVWSGAEFVVRGCLNGCPSLVDRVDCLALTSWRAARVARSWRTRASAVREVVDFARYERRAADGVSATLVVGEDDARWLRRITGRRVVVAPNGVHLQTAGRHPKSAQPTVVFSGVMSYQPNVDAVRHFAVNVWPAIRSAVPDARFLVAGRTPTAEVSALAAIDGIDVLGGVDDMAATLAACWVAVAPMVSGAGIKNKVLEAWANGTPVVMTRMAANGLMAPPGAEGLVGDEPAGMADVIAKLCRDPALAGELGEVARRHVVEHHSWSATAATIDEELRRARASR